MPTSLTFRSLTRVALVSIALACGLMSARPATGAIDAGRLAYTPVTMSEQAAAAFATVDGEDAEASPAERSTRIVGGTEAAPGAWPWAVSVWTWFADSRYEGGGYWNWVCGGSLVGERWVLTAAHCVYLDDGRIDPNLWVGVGKHDVYNDGAGQFVAVETDGIYTGAYDPQRITNDIAVLRLAQPVPHQAVRFAVAGQELLASPGTQATAIGWGQTQETGTISPVLRQATLPVLDASSCVASHNGYDPLAHLCAGSLDGGAGICFGDSGGALMGSDPLGHVEIGISSFVVGGCARMGEASFFTRLTTYGTSIVQALAGDPFAPVGAPQAATGDPLVVGLDEAAVSVAVTPNGLATYYTIEYGPTPAFGSTVVGYAGAGAPANLTVPLRGLAPGTTYSYRVTATSAAGVAVGAVRTLSTAAAVPAPAPQPQPQPQPEPQPQPQPGQRVVRPPAKPLAPRIMSASSRVSAKNTVSIVVACPARAKVMCRGAVGIVAGGKVIGASTYAIDPGRSKPVVVRLERLPRQLASGASSQTVEARAVNTGPDDSKSDLVTRRFKLVRR
jgi:secreted trypsin-like serine protease